MNGSSRLLLMILVGILLAGGIIAGVTTLQQQGVIPNNSPSTIVGTGTTFTSTQTTIKITNSSPPTGVLAAQMTDPPNLPIGVSHVYINFSDIEVHTTTSGNISVWFAVVPADSIDLTSLVNISETLGSLKVPSGIYDQLRFAITSAVVTYYGHNYTASLPLGEIAIPIDPAGIRVNANGSAGIVIEISPSVIPQRAGSSVRFSLIPAARVFPVPSQDWNDSLKARGAKMNVISKSWFLQSQVSLSSRIEVTNAVVSSNLLVLILNNTGNTSIILSSISILSRNESAFGNTIASFVILSNSSVVQPSAQMSGSLGDYRGVIIRPNQTEVLLFVGSIDTLNSFSTPSSQYVLSGGVSYTIEIADPFGAKYDISVISSYQAKS